MTDEERDRSARRDAGAGRKRDDSKRSESRRGGYGRSEGSGRNERSGHSSERAEYGRPPRDGRNGSTQGRRSDGTRSETGGPRREPRRPREDSQGNRGGYRSGFRDNDRSGGGRGAGYGRGAGSDDRRDRPSRGEGDRRRESDRSDRRDDRPRSNESGTYRPRSDRPSYERKRDDRASGAPRTEGRRYDSGAPQSRDQRGEQRGYRSDRPERSDRPRRDDRPDRPRRDERPAREERGYRGGRPEGRSGAPRRFDGQVSSDRAPFRPRHDDPPLPDEVTFRDLDRETRASLRTLSKENADRVGRHLVMVGVLLETDPELAYQHAQAAVRTAGRVDVVREVAGVAAYRAEHYAEALREFRAARRLSGSDAYLALMADCERGLGRPQRALDLVRSPEAEGLRGEPKVELRIVEAGARADLGDIAGALAVLDRTARALGNNVLRGRVLAAKSGILAGAGRSAEAAAAEEEAEAAGYHDEEDMDDVPEILVFDADDDELSPEDLPEDEA